MNEIKPLAGNTVADLIAYLQQLPSDCRVDVLKAEYHSYQGYSVNFGFIDNSNLYYSAPWEYKGKSHQGYLEIGEKD